MTRSVSRAIRLVYLTGSRADYAPMRPVLRSLAAEQWVDLSVLVTGMHLLPRFGRTDRLIARDGYRIAARVRLRADDDSDAAMARDMGSAVIGIADALARLRPDALFVHGDRDEALAGAIAAAHLSVPVIHLGGGDVSGSIDQANRNAITQFAALHLATTPRAMGTLRALGIAERATVLVGEPGLGDLVARRQHRPTRVDPFILLSQHPVVGEPGADGQLRATIAALERIGLPVVASYPNSDAGGRGMIRELDRAAKRHPSWRVMASAASAEAYHDLLLTAAVMVGNSSAALIEAPSAGLPAVNVGSRQHGRIAAANVVNASYAATAIEAAIRRQLRVADRRRGRPYANPYGDGRAPERTVAAIRRWWTRPSAR